MPAGVAELVDAVDLKSIGHYARVGSSPTLGTINSSFVPLLGAGWSSPVARRAHNPKAVGSNPTPATIFFMLIYYIWRGSSVG